MIRERRREHAESPCSLTEAGRELSCRVSAQNGVNLFESERSASQCGAQAFQYSNGLGSPELPRCGIQCSALRQFGGYDILPLDRDLAGQPYKRGSGVERAGEVVREKAHCIHRSPACDGVIQSPRRRARSEDSMVRPRIRGVDDELVLAQRLYGKSAGSPLSM